MVVNGLLEREGGGSSPRSPFSGKNIAGQNFEGPGEQRERQPQGPGQGVVHFFQIYL